MHFTHRHLSATIAGIAQLIDMDTAIALRRIGTKVIDRQRAAGGLCATSGPNVRRHVSLCLEEAYPPCQR